MNHDETFRIVLVVGALILVPIMAYHRLKSQSTGEKLDRRQEGVWANRVCTSPSQHPRFLWQVWLRTPWEDTWRLNSILR